MHVRSGEGAERIKFLEIPSQCRQDSRHACLYIHTKVIAENTVFALPKDKVIFATIWAEQPSLLHGGPVRPSVQVYYYEVRVQSSQRDAGVGREGRRGESKEALDARREGPKPNGCETMDTYGRPGTPSSSECPFSTFLLFAQIASQARPAGPARHD